jgi:Tol biopolymer transport system component
VRKPAVALVFAGVAAVGSVFVATVVLGIVPIRDALAADGECSPSKVGQVIRRSYAVRVRGQDISKAFVGKGDWMRTDGDGYAVLCLRKGSTTCEVGGGTILRVGPPKKKKKKKKKMKTGQVLLYVSRADDPLSCETSAGGSKYIETPGTIITFTDPVFSIAVGRKQTLVKVRRGAAVVARKGKLSRGVTLGSSQRVSVPTGRDPLKPTTFRLSTLPPPERQALRRLERLAPRATDKTPPTVRITRRPPPLSSSDTAVFSFVAEAGSILSCALDSRDFRFCTRQQGYEGLNPGRHTLLVRATDEAGNTGPARSYSWTIHRPASAPIAFESNRDGNWEIYVIDPDGSDETRLTASDAVDVDSAWSPDGARLAFESARDRAGPSEIYAMNADGTGQTRLTVNPANDRNPKWSPFGTQIAFESDRDGNYELYVMDASGRSPVRLTENSARDSDPAWSPDAKKLVFESDRDGNDEIYVMPVDGGREDRLTTNPAGETNAAWSPDGTKIAFESDRDGNHEIYVMNVDGSGQIRLTTDAAQDSDPAWSPDGRRIAFASNRDGNFEIYVMNADGSSQMRVTHSPGDDLVPSW